jgi:hypothetical protein
MSVIQLAGYSIKSVTLIHGYRARYVCRRALLGKYNEKIVMEWLRKSIPAAKPEQIALQEVIETLGKQ